ncbi:MAG: DUF5662 family protein [Candidatus Paceibacterota bacterium]
MKRLYLPQVLWHKWFVLLAGLRVKGIPFWRLVVHDWTKFLPVEYGVYRRKCTGGRYFKDEWEKAKWHHYLSNPHHYQYWIKDGVPDPMPDVFVREMVADWMAAGRSYEGSWEIQGWLAENYKKFNLHPSTLERLKVILSSQGLAWPEG